MRRLFTTVVVALVFVFAATAVAEPLASNAVIERSALWDDVTVGDGARLTECIVADGAIISAGAVFERCAIVPAGEHRPANGERLEQSLLIRGL